METNTEEIMVSVLRNISMISSKMRNQKTSVELRILGDILERAYMYGRYDGRQETITGDYKENEDQHMKANIRGMISLVEGKMGYNALKIVEAREIISPLVEELNQSYGLALGKIPAGVTLSQVIEDAYRLGYVRGHRATLHKTYRENHAKADKVKKIFEQ